MAQAVVIKHLLTWLQNNIKSWEPAATEMVLSKEDRILIKNLYYFKGYGAKRLISEFPYKGWKKTTVNDFLKRLKETGSTMRKSGSGRPRPI